MATDYLLCLVLIEILPQLYLHPGHDEKVAYILELAFNHFKYKDP